MEKIPVSRQVRAYAVEKHIIQEHVTRWSQISGQINSIDPGLVDTASFRKETPPLYYRQRIQPVNGTHDTNCINHCCRPRRLLGGSLHCLKSTLHLLISLLFVLPCRLTLYWFPTFWMTWSTYFFHFAAVTFQRLLWPVRMAENC